MRNKQILLRDHAHGDGAICILLGAEIAFYELTREMQGRRIDRGSSKVPQQRPIDLVIPCRGDQAQQEYGKQNRSQLTPVHRSLNPELEERRIRAALVH